jgi:hypothetical protein
MYRIIAMQDSSHDCPAEFELYRVEDEDGRNYLESPTGHFSVAIARFCELTGEDPDAVDGFHSLEIDGVEMSFADF